MSVECFAGAGGGEEGSPNLRILRTNDLDDF
jgi:hypothetical protein